MGPKKLLLVIAALVVVLGGGTAVVLTQRGDDKKTEPTTSQQPATQPAAQQTERYVTYNGEEGKTALELLKKANATVVTKDSSYGPYVDSINGVVGGTEGKYWAFYVNGKLASVGADAYKTKTGDKIEWKFEK